MRTVSTGRSGVLTLVGRARSGYVVLTTTDSGSATTLRRVRTDGSTVTLHAVGRRYASDAHVSPDGRRVAYTTTGRTSTTVFVRKSRDGSLLARKSYAGFSEVLAHRQRVLLSGFSTGVVRWFDPATRSTVVLDSPPLASADLRHDRAVQIVEDPVNGFDGICLVYARLSDPTDTRWRSCTEKPLATSPNGRRMVTTNIAADGLGTGVLQVRDAETFAVSATLRTSGYFGQLHWEDDNSFVVFTWRKGRAAMVRYALDGTLERVSEVVRMDVAGTSSLQWSFPTT